MAGVAITRTDMSAADLRAAAKRSGDARQAARILAIAMVLDGFSREERRGFAGWTAKRCATGFTATIRQVWMGLPTGGEAGGPQA